MSVGKYGLVFQAGLIYAEYTAFSEEWEDNDGDVGKMLANLRNKHLRKRFDKELVRVSHNCRQVEHKSERHGGWNPQMAKYCGQYGTVVRKDSDDNTVRVQFGDKKAWWFNQDVVISDISKADQVVLSVKNVAHLRKVMDTSGLGWHDNMKELPGKTGRVVGCKVQDSKSHPVVCVDFGGGEDQYFCFPHSIVLPSNSLVRVADQASEVKAASAGLSAWRPQTASYSGMCGILQRHVAGGMQVKFGDGKSGVFGPEVVEFVFRQGDYVRLNADDHTQLRNVVHQSGVPWQESMLSLMGSIGEVEGSTVSGPTSKAFVWVNFRGRVFQLPSTVLQNVSEQPATTIE